MFLFKINRTTGWSARGGRPWAPANGRVVGKRWPTLGTGEWPRGRQEVADPGHRRMAAWSARGGRPWAPANGRVVGKRWPTLGTGEWPRGRHDVVGKRWPTLGTGPISTGARSPKAG